MLLSLPSCSCACGWTTLTTKATQRRLILSLCCSHPLHALVLVVGRLLDAVGVVLEGGVTPGVVLLLLTKNTTKRPTLGKGGGKNKHSQTNFRPVRTKPGHSKGKHGNQVYVFRGGLKTARVTSSQNRPDIIQPSRLETGVMARVMKQACCQLPRAQKSSLSKKTHDRAFQSQPPPGPVKGLVQTTTPATQARSRTRHAVVVVTIAICIGLLHLSFNIAAVRITSTVSTILRTI